MKSKLIAFAIAACLAAPMFAQSTQDQTGAQTPAQPRGHMKGRMAGGHGGFANPDKQLERMSKHLNLSADQQLRIKPIIENQASQMKALREDTTTPRKDLHAKMKSLRQNTMAEIRNVLTPEQQQKFDEGLKNRMRGRRAPGSPNQNPA